MSQAAEGKLLENMMPTIEDTVETTRKQIQMRAFKDIREGTLTPERAYAYWMELNGAFQMLHRLQTRVNISQQAREDIAPLMELDQ
jgi:hypothetical protein